MKIKTLSVTLLIVLLAAGCGQTDDGQSEPIQLDGSSWTVLRLGGQAPLSGTTLTLTFSDNGVGGHSGCNSYGGPYTLDEAALRFEALEMTEMACAEPEGVMEQESAYFAALQTVTEVRLAGEQLEMLDESGQAVLRLERQADFEGDPADLLQTEWQLLTLDGSPLDSELVFTIAFAEDQYSGLAGCRHYAGGYTAGDGSIRFTGIEMLEEECTGAGNDYYEMEGRFTDSLTWARDWRIVDDQLQIRTERGEMLIFGPATSRPDATPSPDLLQTTLPAGLILMTADGLWRVEADGQLLQLTNRLDVTLSPVALQGSGEGQGIFFQDPSADSNDSDIWLLDLGTGEEQDLTFDANRRECCAQWWPDRPDVIVFGSWPLDSEIGPSTGHLTIVQTDGSGYRVLSETSESNALPAPSPDGETIAYDQGGSPWLYQWETGPVPFDPARYGFSTPPSLRVGSPAWSPDGSHLAWVVGGQFDEGWRIAVAVFDLEAGTSRLIHPYEPVGVGGWPAAPVWSPDSRWLAYNLWPVADPTENGLWIFDADGESEWFLGEGSSGPFWSPDGQWLLFGSETGVWMAEAGTWETTRIDVPSGATVVGWTEAGAQ